MRPSASRLFLALLGLLLGVTSHLAAAPAKGTPGTLLRVGVFKGLGADPECLSDAVEALKIDPAIEPRILTAADILEGGLEAPAAAGPGRWPTWVPAAKRRCWPS